MISIISKAYMNLLLYPKYPLGITLYLNNICNLQCSFCEIGQRNRIKAISKKNTALSKEEIDKVINLCLRTKVNRIYITGGEPFLSKNIWYLLETCQEDKIIIEGITTNGVLLDKLQEQEISLLNHTVRDIIISIDSANEIEHDKSRGVTDTFQKIRRFFLNNKKRKLYKSSFSFNVVVHSKNVNELKGIVDLAIAWKIKHINFQPMSPKTIFVDMEKAENKEIYIKDFNINIFKKRIEDLEKYCKERNISSSLNVFRLWAPYYFKYLNSNDLFFDYFPPKFLCSKVFNYIHINYNGDFIPCTNLKPIANINDEDCFEKWQNTAQKLKVMFKQKKYFDQCKYCFCDFPTSLRLSLVYFPLKNINLLAKLANYYMRRAKDKRIYGSSNNYYL